MQINDVRKNCILSMTEENFNVLVEEINTNLGQKAHLGIKEDRTLGASVKVSKDADGLWFFGEKQGYNPISARFYIPPAKFPNLFNSLCVIEAKDPTLIALGGRVTITKFGAFRKTSQPK